MSRHKGRAAAKAIERDFPYIVEIEVPLGGLGRRLDAMYDWHAARSLKPRHGQGRRADERDIVRWCFASAEAAHMFAAEFGAGRPCRKTVAEF